ncbi:hypothetical protein B0E46_15690 [Rhodanobacter sp. B04]|nr:hypothetical protein B0E46_15690 [Rhodanobacter sp. B04]
MAVIEANEVSKERFFDALRSENRDVMPSQDWDANRELFSTWIDVRGREVFGWSRSNGRFALARVGGAA